MKGLWLEKYERAIQFYRLATRSNQKLIELSDMDESMEPKKTKTPRQVDLGKMKPYQDIIEYIDAIAYGKTLPIDEKIYELEELKKERINNFNNGESGLDSKIFNDLSRFIDRAIYDLKTIKSERIALSPDKLSISLIRGEISKQQALNEVKAKLTEIDFAIEDQIRIDFVEKGKDNLDIFTQYLLGKASPWDWYKEQNAELAEIIRAAGYTTLEVMDLCKMEKSLEKEIVELNKETTEARPEPATTGASPEPIRIPYSKLPDIAAFWKSNELTKYLTEIDFCTQYRQADGSEIKSGSLRQAWAGGGLYAKRSGQDVLKEWIKAEQEKTTLPTQERGPLLNK